MDNRKQKEKDLRKEIARSLLLDEADKKFWTENLATLPGPIFENVFKAVTAKNQAVDKYIQEALKNDPDKKYLSGLKAEIKKIKEKAFSLEETAEKGSLEKNLQKQIQNL